MPRTPISDRIGTTISCARRVARARFPRSRSALKHRQLNHALLDLATCESPARDTLERVPMLVEIAEGLILGSKRRLETAHLPNRTDRQNERNGLSLALPGLGHDPDILGHGPILSAQGTPDRLPNGPSPTDLRAGPKL